MFYRTSDAIAEVSFERFSYIQTRFSQLSHFMFLFLRLFHPRLGLLGLLIFLVSPLFRFHLPSSLAEASFTFFSVSTTCSSTSVTCRSVAFRNRIKFGSVNMPNCSDFSIVLYELRRSLPCLWIITATNLSSVCFAVFKPLSTDS